MKGNFSDMWWSSFKLDHRQITFRAGSQSSIECLTAISDINRHLTGKLKDHRDVENTAVVPFPQRSTN